MTINLLYIFNFVFISLYLISVAFCLYHRSMLAPALMVAGLPFWAAVIWRTLDWMAAINIVLN